MPVDQDLSSQLLHCQLLNEEIVLDDTYHPDNTVLPLAHLKMKKQTVLLWVDQLPQYGFSLLDADSLSEETLAKDIVEATCNTLENNQIKLTVGADGLIEILDKKTNQTYINQHRLQSIQQQGDSYNAAPVPNSEADIANLESIEILLNGPCRAELKLHYQFGFSGQRLQTNIVLEAGKDSVYFKTTWNNQFNNKLIQVGFDSERPIEQVQAEGHFNPIIREYDPNYHIEQAMPAEKFKELKTNTGSIQRWIQWQNQALITKGLCEYEVKNNQLCLSLHRGFGALSSDTTGVRGSQAGPPLETPEGQCINRELNAEYLWSPIAHPEANDLFANMTAQADCFYGAVYGIHYAQHTAERVQTIPGYRIIKGCFGSPHIHWSNPHLVLSAIQLHQNGFLLRVSNPTGFPQNLSLNLLAGLEHWYKTDALGEKAEIIEGKTITLDPYGLINLLASRL
jgi:alpha-mannosidase